MTSGAERRLHILQELTGGRRPVSALRLCEVATEVVGVSGAGVMLMSGEASAGRACASDAVATAIEDLQFALGEGPCLDAYFQGRPVLEPNLAAPEHERWPAFSAAAVDAGAGAVFGFPLQLGAARVGALNLYCAEPLELSAGQHADALVTAELVTSALLTMQAEAPPGALATEIETGGDLQLVVHQAAGMVAAQLEVRVAEALIRLRAFAFGNERLLPEVARDVVARRLRFDAITGDDEPGP